MSTPAPAPAPVPTVHQLKVTLTSVRPAVWRRTQIPSDTTLGDLSALLCALFDWDDFGHLHSFEVRGNTYGPPELSDNGLPFGAGTYDEDTTTLSLTAPRPGDRFTYTYDLGDCWEHLIEVETITDAEGPDAVYPRCLDGQGLAPEEDTGRKRPGTFDPAETDRLVQDFDWNADATGRPADPLFAGIVPGLSGVFDSADAPFLDPAPPFDPAELAAEADLSPLLHRTLRLAALIGTEGRSVTGKQVLRPAEAQETARALGLPDMVVNRERYSPREGTRSKPRSATDLPELHRLWTLARDTGLITVDRSKATADPELLAYNTLPAERRLEVWSALLAASLRHRVTEESTRPHALLSQDPEPGDLLAAYAALLCEAAAGHFASTASLSLLLAGSSVADPELGPSTYEITDAFAIVADMTGELLDAGVLAERAPDVPITDAEAKSLRQLADEARPLGEDLVQAIETSRSIKVTGVGTYGLRRFLSAHGWQDTATGDCANLEPAELLLRITDFTPSAAAAEAGVWLAAKPDPVTALQELFAAAHGKQPDAPARRSGLYDAVIGARPLLGDETLAGLLHAQAEDRWLAPLAADLLHTWERGPEPTLTQRLWLDLDELATLRDQDPEDFTDQVRTGRLPELLADPGAPRALARLDHPHARKLLTRVAAALEDRDLARRIRTALGPTKKKRPR